MAPQVEISELGGGRGGRGGEDRQTGAGANGQMVCGSKQRLCAGAGGRWGLQGSWDRGRWLCTPTLPLAAFSCLDGGVTARRRDACYEEAAEGFGATARSGEEPRPWRGCSRGSSRRLLRKEECKCKRSTRYRKTPQEFWRVLQPERSSIRHGTPSFRKSFNMGAGVLAAEGPGALNSPPSAGESWGGLRSLR